MIFNFNFRISAGGLVMAVFGLVLLLAPGMALAGSKAKINVEQAKVAFTAGNYQDALVLLDEAVGEEPDNAEAYHWAGLCQLALDKPESAIPLLAKSAELAPEAVVYGDLAWAQVRSGRYENGESSADQALALDPGNEAATLYKAEALMGQRRFEEAVPLFDAVASSETYGQAALYYAGVCLAQSGRTGEAAGYFQRAHDLDPDTQIGRKAGEYAGAMGEGAVPSARKPWSARIRLLYQYDSNIVPVNNEDFLPEDVTHMKDGRAVLDVDARYRFVDTSAGQAYVRYMGYASWQFEESMLNIMYHRGEFGGYYQTALGGARVRLGGRTYYLNNSVDNDFYSDLWMVSPEVKIYWNDMLETRLVIEGGGETFDDPGDGDNDRDNTRVTTTIYQHFLFDQGRVNTWVGYGFGQVNASGDNYNRVDQNGHAGVMLMLPRNSLASLVFRYEERDYPDSSFDRHEKRYIGNLAFQTPVYKWINAYASIVYMSVDANLTPLEYERWIYTLGILAEF